MERRKAVKFITAIMLAVTLSLSIVVACPSFSITSKAVGGSDSFNNFTLDLSTTNKLIVVSPDEPYKFTLFFWGTLNLAPHAFCSTLFHVNPDNEFISSLNTAIEYSNPQIFWDSKEYTAQRVLNGNSYMVSYQAQIVNRTDNYVSNYFYFSVDATVYNTSVSSYTLDTIEPWYKVNGHSEVTTGTVKTAASTATLAFKNTLMWIKKYLTDDTWKIEIPDINVKIPEQSGSVNLKTDVGTYYIEPNGHATSSSIRNVYSHNTTFVIGLDYVGYGDEGYYGEYHLSDVVQSIRNMSTLITNSVVVRQDMIYNMLQSIYSAVTALNTNTLLQESQKQTAELEKQTEEAKKQTEEQKKQTEALTKYENADKMDSEAGTLSGAISEYDQVYLPLI